MIERLARARIEAHNRADAASDAFDRAAHAAHANPWSSPEGEIWTTYRKAVKADDKARADAEKADDAYYEALDSAHKRSSL